jgi:hypothetical protein
VCGFGAAAVGGFEARDKVDGLAVARCGEVVGDVGGGVDGLLDVG